MPGTVVNNQTAFITTGLEASRSNLAKKATFEAALQDISEIIKSNPGQFALSEVESKLVEVLARCVTLLKTRYTSLAFWTAVSKLLETAQTVVTTVEGRTKLTSWQIECAAFLDEPAVSAEPATPAQASQGYLFQGQLSQGDAEPQQPANPLQELMHLLAAQQVAVHEEEGHQATPEEQAEAEAYTTRLEEALAASLADAEGQGAAATAPPAAKHAVKALVREILSADRLEQLGGVDTQCAVCREDLEVGDEVQIMPCNNSHVFHPPCLAPWLQMHNSCPVCRHELETDDMHYEHRKERDQREAEERKGAANAVSHVDFLYT